MKIAEDPQHAGRAAVFDVKVVKQCGAPIRPARQGDHQPGFFGFSNQYAQWTRQLRRMQHFVRIVKVGSPQSLAESVLVWEAILNLGSRSRGGGSHILAPCQVSLVLCLLVLRGLRLQCWSVRPFVRATVSLSPAWSMKGNLRPLVGERTILRSSSRTYRSPWLSLLMSWYVIGPLRSLNSTGRKTPSFWSSLLTSRLTCQLQLGVISLRLSMQTQTKSGLTTFLIWSPAWP